MIRNRDMDDLDEDLWLLETRVRYMKYGLIVIGIFLEMSVIFSIIALGIATGTPLW